MWRNTGVLVTLLGNPPHSGSKRRFPLAYPECSPASYSLAVCSKSLHIQLMDRWGWGGVRSRPGRASLSVEVWTYALDTLKAFFFKAIVLLISRVCDEIQKLAVCSSTWCVAIVGLPQGQLVKDAPVPAGPSVRVWEGRSNTKYLEEKFIF